MMFKYSLFPKITLPTRFSNHSASLLDNIYCKIGENTLDTVSGILFTGISDHLPVLLGIKSMFKKQKARSPKYVKCKINKPEAINNFLKELQDNDIYDQLNHSLEIDPNKNYESFVEHITKIKEKHLPYRFVKFNKHKHKGNKWITYGIINSMNSRDKKFMQLKKLNVGSPDYLVLKQNLSCINSILKRAIREAKQKYYYETFEKHKNDIKNTWKAISDILNKSSKSTNPIKEIKKGNRIVQEKSEICDIFNNFFVNIGPNLAEKIKPSRNVPFTSYLKKICILIVAF